MAAPIVVPSGRSWPGHGSSSGRICRRLAVVAPIPMTPAPSGNKVVRCTADLVNRVQFLHQTFSMLLPISLSPSSLAKPENPAIDDAYMPLSLSLSLLAS